MKQNRRLALRREALSELTAADLRAAAAGQMSAVGPTCDFFECITVTRLRTLCEDCKAG